MRMLTKRTKMAAAVLAAAFGAPSAVFAASVNIDLDTATAGVQATRDVTPPATFDSTINFVGDGVVTNVSGRLDYDTTRLDATVTSGSGVTCTAVDALGRIAFTTTSGSGSALASQVLCNVTFTVPGTVTPPQSIPLTFSNMNFASSAGGDTTQGGTINAVAAPVTQAPTLTFTPPAGSTITLTGGSGSIAVAAGAGTAGTSTSLVCTPSAGFTSTVTGSPFAPNSSGTVNLGCTPTPGGPVQNGTVSCDPTQSAGTDQPAQVFNVTCPAAPANQAPTLTFTPPPPGPITLSPGGTGSIAVAAGPGTPGTTTSLACTPSAGFTSTVTGSPFAPNTTGSVNLGCTPTPGGPVRNGTVSCDPTQSAGTDQAPAVYNVTCPAAPAAPSEFNAPLSAALFGAPGTTATGSIPVSNTGTGTLTITCAPPTGGFTVTSGPAATVPAGGSTTIGLSCVTPGAAGATSTGSLVCTTNDADEGTVTFALSCSSQIVSVPALGNTAKGMLVALLAGLGLFGFAMRRRIV
ncbi:MAG TPA: hypothetical protein VND91_06275 [Candidatus Saccharimonadia bacterium]|nr:hypothetical protein [Candidatus Saccharimonadia bacterium]